MIKLGVIYGGKSTEHEISIISAKSIIKNLNKEKYKLFPIYIAKDGNWYEENNKKIENIIEYLHKLDIVFPVLHGLGGEDGSIQGMFELFNIKYVGCKILSSSIGMDKAYAKVIFEKAKINQAKYIYIKKYKKNKCIYIDEEFNEKSINVEELAKLVEKKLKYPVFIKPSNSGSSVGINKAINKKELIKSVENAGKYDNKILIEQAIIGREVECAVLGSDKNNVEVSEVGEVFSAEDFYSYSAKYNNSASKTEIPAVLEEKQKREIQDIAKKAFTAIDGRGLARVDCFIENKTNKIYISEINTMPGFTEISMYPKLFEAIGYTYSDLLDKIIEVD